MTTNVPNEVTVAIRKANNVEKGQKAHHTALCAMMALAVKCPEEGDGLDIVQLYTLDRMAKSPDSLCTKATVAWLEKHFGIHVTKTGIAKRGRTWEGKGLTTDAHAAAKAEPWFNLARDLAFKVPGELSFKAVASQAAKRQHAGADLPTKDELYDAFMAGIAEAKRGDRFADWCAEFDTRLAKGEVERIEVN